jgi:hypothetical protein
VNRLLYAQVARLKCTYKTNNTNTNYLYG